MSKALVVPFAIFYYTAPFLFLVLLGLQLKLIGRSILGWLLILGSIRWAVAVIMNPYVITWVPNVLIADAQGAYLVVRGLVLLAYLGVAITSLAKKSEPLRRVSFSLMILLMADLTWSHLGGRYVGP